LGFIVGRKEPKQSDRMGKIKICLLLPLQLVSRERFIGCEMERKWVRVMRIYFFPSSTHFSDQISSAIHVKQIKNESASSLMRLSGFTSFATSLKIHFEASNHKQTFAMARALHEILK
jgi:hypothetical protein